VLASTERGAVIAPTFLGRVQAARRAELSFQVAGRVVDVKVLPGHPVRRGDVLATIDTTSFSMQLSEAESRLAEAVAVGKEASSRVGRLRGLVEIGAAPESEWEAAIAAAEAASASVQAMTATRDALAWQRQQGELRAPFDGFVAVRAIDPGQSVSPGVPAIMLDGSGREIRVPVPVAHAQGLRVGHAAVTHDGSQQSEARVLRVGQRQAAGGLVEVTLELLEGGAPGQVMPLRFASPADAALWVPARAVVPTGRKGEGYVMRYQPEIGRVIRIEVAYGDTKGGLIQVVSGLEAGDLVVARGTGFVEDGAPVKPLKGTI
jgi:RND family efflux transporter MFP subunit